MAMEHFKKKYIHHKDNADLHSVRDFELTNNLDLLMPMLRDEMEQLLLKKHWTSYLSSRTLLVTHGQSLAGAIRSAPQDHFGNLHGHVNQVICPNITDDCAEQFKVYLQISSDSVR